MSRGQSTSSNISSTDKLLHTMGPPNLKARPGLLRKPVIAALAGTTKAVSLSHRPQPPAKPRSDCALSEGGSSKLHTTFQQVSGEKIKAPRMDQSRFIKEQNQLISGSSNVATKESPHKSQNQAESISIASSLRSSFHLLEEARLIAGLEPPFQDDQQRASEESLKESGHIEGGNLDAALSDQERRPGCGYSIDKEGKRDNLELCFLEKTCPPKPLSHPASCGASIQTEPAKDSSDGGGLRDLSSQVTNEDVIMAAGCNLTPVQRAERKSCGNIQGLSLLATWKPKKDSTGFKTIHHLCTTPVRQVVPVELQLVSRICHTQNLTPAMAHSIPQRAEDEQMPNSDTRRLVSEGVFIDSTELPAQTDCVFHMPKQTSDTLEDWKRIAEYYVERPRIIMSGRAATLCPNELRMFWNPMPPKFFCAPSVMKDTLFSKYQKSHNETWEETLIDEVDKMMEGSVCRVRKTVQCSPKGNTLPLKCKSVADFRPAVLQTPSGFIRNKQARRPRSAPLLTPDLEPHLRLQSGFTSLSQELKHVRCQQNTALAGESLFDAKQTEPSSSEGACQTVNPSKNPHKAKERARMSCSKGKATRKRKKIKSYVWKKLNEPTPTLTRSKSLRQLQLQPKLSKRKDSCISLPMLLDFESFSTNHFENPEPTAPREWVRVIWNAWFNEVFPPKEDFQSLVALEDKQNLDDDDEEEPGRVQKVLNEGFSAADLEQEVIKLSKSLSECEQRCAFDQCRRGALLIKLGNLDQALEDLSAAISLEPHLLDAYWHRHRIHLLRHNPDRALDDLNVILENNTKHADALVSSADIYKQRGETTQALFYYTQALEVRPDDAEIYFRRAKMYDRMGLRLLAMEDYSKAYTIDCTRTDALMIRGMHHFKSFSWAESLEDFSLILKQEPGNSKARTYRGRVFSKLGHFEKAVEDFTLAVQLNPSDWLAFYHRGCLLREIMPQMALRDLSTSVLINDRAENLNAFLHRGLVYITLSHWQQAMADFEAVIKLDRSTVAAHVSLGLISMLKLGRHYEAIKCFNEALQENPTYVKAYVCRARAYYCVKNLSRAVKDLTQAIHLKPDACDLYIMRGKFLYEMKRFDLTGLCIRYAAEMKSALGLSLLQQAVIHSFLGKDANAIVCLEEAVDTLPSHPTLILLGRTLMREHRYTEAVESFRKALSLLGTKTLKPGIPQEVSEVFYLIGMCYMMQQHSLQESEDSLLLQAFFAFNSSVNLNPNHAQALHQRGLCRVHLHDSTGVQDFNRALRINPDLYQVHLSRAVLYGAEGRYAKALLDCNDAIRIQPKSSRAYLYCGALKFYLKAYERAVEDLTVAIQLAPRCSFIYYNRAICFQKMQDYNPALRDYNTMLLLGCRTELELKVLINRALLYVELNDYSSALQDMKAAAEKRPADPLIHHTQGVLHHRLGQLQEAVDSYSEALRLDPLLQDCLVGRGNVFTDYGHNQARMQAQRDFLSALHLNPLCMSARINLAYNLQVSGFFKQAWNQFSVAVEVTPECWAGYEGRAVTNLQMGNTFAALQDINKALEYQKCSEQLFTNRGLIHQLMGNKSSAMKDYQTAISISPGHAQAYVNAGNLFFYNGQFEQACEHYSRAVELDPSDEAAILNRAITHALLRKVSESLQDFKDALILNPMSAHAYFNRASLHCSLRQFQSAERDLTQALMLEPGDALLRKLRADVRGHLGWREQAMEDYRIAVELLDL